ITRYATGGVDVGGMPGTARWEVTLTARGTSEPGKPFRVEVSNPPSFRRQHVYDETYESDELAAHEGRAAAARDKPDRKTTLKPVTTPMVGAGAQSYVVTQKFRCTLGAFHPNDAMKSGDRLDNKPNPEKDHTLAATARIEFNHPDILDQARELAKGQASKQDQYRAFLEHVRGQRFRDTDGNGSALDCQHKGGDAAGRARLLVALCRARDIPARVVTAINLRDDAQPVLHRWAEAWIDDSEPGRWVPADPTFGHYGHRNWPPTYLVVRLDDEPLVRGPGSEAKVTVLAEPLVDQPAADDPPMRAFWRAVSFGSLPPAEQHLVRFVLVLPLGALVVGFFRVVVGTKTFGVFTPALLGLIFRDTRALPWGLGIFAGTVLVGWAFRKTLDRYSLLMVPRTAILLTMVCVFLLSVVNVAAKAGVHITGYVALFPLVILTHMVERFWTVEVEDGTWSAFKTLVGTVFVAVAVALVVGPEAVSRWFFRFPETLLVVVAALLMLGRYTGYRLTELYRFQDVIELQAAKLPYIGNGTAEAAPAKTAEVPALPAPAGGKP
ncbi:MAG TPA: 7TM domain-containing protein, partial [Urbifossiella sp.]|nr:7TM domain-containing protein [Urbifossiella sp.]